MKYCDCGSDHERDPNPDGYRHPNHECFNFPSERVVNTSNQFGPVREVCSPCAVYLCDTVQRFARIDIFTRRG